MEEGDISSDHPKMCVHATRVGAARNSHSRFLISSKANYMLLVGRALYAAV